MVHLEQAASLIKNQFSEFFSDRLITQALSLISKNKVQPSFTRGEYKTRFIISGLIIDNPTIQTKVSFKYETKELKYNCQCQAGKKNELCEHVCAFFIYFVLSDYQEFLNQENASQTSMLDDSAVSPYEYGTYIKSPSKLQNTSGETYYTHLKYKLLDESIIPFPKLDDIQIENIGISFKTAHDIKNEILNQKHFTNHYAPHFYLNINGEENTSVSVFENFCLFDWKNGRAYHIPQKLKALIHHLKNEEQAQTPTRFFNKLQFHGLLGRLLIQFNDLPYTVEAPTAYHLSVYIEPAENKKNFYAAQIVLKDNSNNILPIPEILKYFVNHNGELAQFSSRIELSRFIDSFYSANSDEWKKFIYTHPKKNIFSQNIEALKSELNLIDYDEKTHHYYSMEYEYIFNFFEKIFKIFGESIIKSTEYISRDQTIVCLISRKNLELHIAQLFTETERMGIDLYFQSKKATRWNSNVSFNRNKEELNWFDLTISMTTQDLEFIKTLDFQNRHFSSEEEFVLLTDEDIQKINFIKKYLSEAEKVEEQSDPENKSFHLKLNRCRLFDLYEIYNQSGFDLLNDEEKEVCQKLLNIDKIPKVPFPTEIKGDPRHYQIIGFQWMHLLYELKLGACLADDMGLGKTFQTIAFIQSIIDQVDRILIVCPVSILINWAEEFKKFSNMGVNLYYGENRTLDDKNKIIITSYGLLRREAKDILSSIKWDVLILDEVQNLKNMRSQGAQAARLLNSQYRICLTGTPVENDLSEFYNIIDLTVPGIWGSTRNLNFFQKNKDARFIARDISRPFILRRTKNQVLKELPEKTEQIVYLNFTGEEKSLYAHRLTEVQQQFQNNTQSKKYGQILKDLLSLRQLCLWQDQNKKILSTKIEFMLEMLEQILDEGHQILIFSQFTTYLDLIQTRITQKNWSFSRIDGSYSIKRRQKQIELFQKGESSIFLISLKAGGLGLNLTEANYIFIMDPWWNPAVENQAIDRAYRIGQEKHVTVYRPIIKNSVEEKVLVLQDRKRELFRDLLDNKDGQDFSGKLSIDDFRMIISE